MKFGISRNCEASKQSNAIFKYTIGSNWFFKVKQNKYLQNAQSYACNISAPQITKLHRLDNVKTNNSLEPSTLVTN